MFTTIDGMGRFFQWKLNQYITEPSMVAGDKVIFLNSSGLTIPMRAYYRGSTIVVDVPNKLLTTVGNIVVYINGRYDTRTVLAVLAGQKPNGYVFMDNTGDWGDVNTETLAMANAYTDSQRITYADIGDVFIVHSFKKHTHQLDDRPFANIGNSPDKIEKIVRITAIIEGKEKVFPAGAITFKHDNPYSLANIDGITYVYSAGGSLYGWAEDENNYVTKVELAEKIYPVPPTFMPDDTIDLDAYGIQVATLVMSGGGTTEYTDADRVQRFATELLEKKPKFALMSLAQTFRCTIAALTENMIGFSLVALTGRTMISAKICIVVSSDKITVVAEVG